MNAIPPVDTTYILSVEVEAELINDGEWQGYCRVFRGDYLQSDMTYDCPEVPDWLETGKTAWEAIAKATLRMQAESKDSWKASAWRAYDRIVAEMRKEKQKAGL